jgi:hypothetical protein
VTDPVEAAAEPAVDERVGSRVNATARDLLVRGRRAARPLPKVDGLAGLPPHERHAALERLRVELYAIASVVAEDTVEHAVRERSDHPPYGLVRSGYTDWRMVLANPTTVEEGSIEDFYALGKAFVDTMVFHLDAAFRELRADDRRAWMLARLDELLALFRVDAGPATRGRLRDGLTFIYGGLQFGAAVSIQLAEVMNRVLDDSGIRLSSAEKAEVLSRSSRPALRMAALNFDHVIVVYQAFLSPPARPGGPQWVAPSHFAVQQRDGRPWSIDFRPDEIVAGKPHTARVDSVTTTYSTHGCPARVSPTGAVPPISRLWHWGVRLAHDTGLLSFL